LKRREEENRNRIDAESIGRKTGSTDDAMRVISRRQKGQRCLFIYLFRSLFTSKNTSFHSDAAIYFVLSRILASKLEGTELTDAARVNFHPCGVCREGATESIPIRFPERFRMTPVCPGLRRLPLAPRCDNCQIPCHLFMPPSGCKLKEGHRQ
jgi:hypothetical protein